MEKFRTEELLECVLTNDELITKGSDLSKKNQEVSRLENAAKTSSSEYKAKINACVAEIESLSLVISTKSELRKVKCEIRYNDPIEGQKTIIRADTAAIVKLEMMNDREKEDLFINALGEQGDQFVFRGRECKADIVEQNNLSQEDAKEWQTMGFPASMESIVDAPLEPSQEYRVIKGDDPKGTGILFQLQKKIAGFEMVKPKKGKGKKSKDTMKAEKSLTITADFICDNIENGDVLGCCQCEEECTLRNANFGNAIECVVNLACSETCPRFIK